MENLHDRDNSEKEVSPILVSGIAGAVGYLAGHSNPKTVVLTPNGSSTGEVIPKEAFFNPFEIDWSLTAFDRSAEEYFYHTGMRPLCSILRILSDQKLNSDQKKRLRARMINILANGGSWFGPIATLSQVIHIDGAYRTFDSVMADNVRLGRSGGRKTFSGDVAAYNSFFAYMGFVDMDFYFRLYRAFNGDLRQGARACLIQGKVRDFFDALFEIPSVVFENSVSKQMAWTRDHSSVKELIDQYFFDLVLKP